MVWSGGDSLVGGGAKSAEVGESNCDFDDGSVERGSTAVAARTNVILTLPFRVDPHTSSDGHLFRACPMISMCAFGQLAFDSVRWNGERNDDANGGDCGFHRAATSSDARFTCNQSVLLVPRIAPAAWRGLSFAGRLHPPLIHHS